MISGATRGAGGPALGRHLARASDNERVIDLEGRGLVATDIRERVAELTHLASHARTRTPLYHVHADPLADRTWTLEERTAWWTAFEAEFDLADRPFAAVLHAKKGREHEHRVYLRIRPDGSAIRLDHDYARREKLARSFEIARGERLVSGAHNRAVIDQLDREGRIDEAETLRRAGLAAIERSRAPLSPDERHQNSRTGIDLGEVRTAALAAWRASDDDRSFRNALAEQGLRLAQGEKTPQLVDASGATHDLRRTLNAASRADGGGTIRAADVRNRLGDTDLPSTAEKRPAALLAPATEISTDHKGISCHDDARETHRERRPLAEGPTLELGSDPGSAGRNDGPGDPARGRPQGDELVAVRAVADGGDGGRSEAAVEPVGAAGRGGAKRSRPHPDPSRDDRRGADPDRDEAGRARARDRIESRRLAERARTRTERLDSLIDVLRDPEAVLARATRQLDAEDTRIRVILAAEPFRDERDRNPAVIAATRLQAIDHEHDGLVIEAAQAARTVEEARAALTVWDRWLPWTTARSRLSLDAAGRSGAAAMSLVAFRQEVEERRRAIRRRAVHIVQRREWERSAWFDRMDVQDALASRPRNQDRREAIRRGDLQVAVSLLRNGEDASRLSESLKQLRASP